MMVSLIMTLILLAILLVLSIVWRTQRALEINATEQIICEPCSALRINGNLPPGCDVQSQGNKIGQCCCKASLVIDALVKKVWISVNNILSNKLYI